MATLLGMLFRWPGPSAFFVVTALLVACGSPSQTPARAPDSGLPGASADAGTTPPPDAGGLPPDGGRAPDGGTATDGGTGSDAGPATDGGTASDAGPATDGGTASDAGPATDGGTPIDGGPATDGGTATDGGDTADGGTTSNECDGLAPAAPGAGGSFSVAASSSVEEAFCHSADTDGLGVAIFQTSNNLEQHSGDLTLVNLLDGGVAGRLQSTAVPIGQASGFLGWSYPGAQAFFSLIQIADDGSVLSTGGGAEPGGGIQANDPSGGLVSLRSTRFGPIVEAWSPTASLRWSSRLGPWPSSSAATGGTALGVDRLGNVLVLSAYSGPQGGAWQIAGQWFTHDGSPGVVFVSSIASGWPAGSEPKLYERVGSGLFLSAQRGGFGEDPLEATWMAAFRPDVDAALPPPALLVSRPQTTLHMVHGGRGYAMLPVSGAAATCAQTIEVLAPSGASCGRATFSIAPSACETRRISVGYDGTVLQKLPTAMEVCPNGQPGCTCTWRHWRGFFR